MNTDDQTSSNEENLGTETKKCVCGQTTVYDNECRLCYEERMRRQFRYDEEKKVIEVIRRQFFKHTIGKPSRR